MRPENNPMRSYMMQFPKATLKEGSSTENNTTLQSEDKHALAVVSLRWLRAGGF